MSNFAPGFISFLHHFVQNADIREDFRSSPNATMAQFGLTDEEQEAFINSNHDEISEFLKADFQKRVHMVTPY